MKGRISDDRGMSLVEATIILLVLATLSAVLAPTIGNYVNDARRVKAREDVEAIGVSLVQMLKDVGQPFPVDDQAVAPTMANRVELLVSAGNIPGVVGADVAIAATAGPLVAQNWNKAIDPANNVELLEDHLVTNQPSYVSAVPTPATGNVGWRGPYITKLANGDSWGYRYAVNTLYLGWATNATLTGLGWNQDAMVVSAGPNGVVDTLFAHTEGDFAGDDIGLVISAATR